MVYIYIHIHMYIYMYICVCIFISYKQRAHIKDGEGSRYSGYIQGPTTVLV